MSSLRSSILGGCLAALAAMLWGCSSVDSAQEPRVVSESPTGSNIPRKDRSGTSVKTIDSDSVQAPLPPISRPPSGAGGG